jgi:signal transduction histidine kinase
MRFYTHVTLRSRLVIGLLTIAILLIAPVAFSIKALFQLHEETRQLRASELGAALLLGRLREGLSDFRRLELALLVSRDTASRAELDEQLGTITALGDSLRLFSLFVSAQTVRTALDVVARSVPDEYSAIVTRNTYAADSISQLVLLPALDRADSGVRVAAQRLRERTALRIEAETRMIEETATIALGALLIALALASAIAVYLLRSISEPVRALEVGMRSVAGGDLTHALGISTKRDDEFGRLAQSFEQMTRQLAELDKLKAEFVSVASHELKTPLSVIAGYLQLLQEETFGPLNEKQKKTLSTIGVQAGNLSLLVKQLLDVSRFEAGGGRLNPRLSPIAPFLEDLEHAFRVLANQRGIDFNVEREEGTPDEVEWDPDRMNEVLGNLLSNAFKFTSRGGAVEVRARPGEGGIRISVRDTGVGIPPDQLPRIFDKFYQAGNQAAGVGTGLGLAIAKEIVEAHGGQITCDSTVGVGTTFTISLPTRMSGTRRGRINTRRSGGAEVPGAPPPA